MNQSQWPEISGYRIEQEIGRGGMATVYLAVQQSLQRQVALKVMKAALAADEEFAERFVREARTAASLQHPGIVSIHDTGNVGHHSYIAMEYVTGGELKIRLQNGALDLSEALRITREIADALDYAHEKGFVHRDVKPENILFREKGSAVLTDFGVARAAGTGTRLTGTGLSIGTPHYMSPEQARGDDVDARSDLYALGIVFHEMLTGQVPFDARDSLAIGIKHLQDPIPKLPERLNQFQLIIDKLLAKDPDDRYQSGAELIEDLDRIEQGEKLKEGRAGTRVMKSAGRGARRKEQGSRKADHGKGLDHGSGTTDHGKDRVGGSRSGLYWGLGGAALAAVLAVGIYFWQDQRRSPPPIGGSTTTVSRPAPQPIETPELEAAPPEIGTRQPETALSESELIASVQGYLNRLGYQVPRSGELDTRTAAGIRAFEESKEMLVTGEIDEILKTALVEAYREIDEAAWREARETDTEQAYLDYIEAHPEGHAVEQVKDKIELVRARLAQEERRRAEQAAAAERQQELVRNIQTELKRLGRPIDVDGVLGPATAEAIRVFERGIDRPERGEATDQVLTALRSAQRWPAPQPGDTFQDCPDCPEMVVIPAGRFTMGSPSNEPQRQGNEGPQRQVNVPAFALGTTPVKFAQWDACVADGGCSHRPGDRGWGRGNRPVINVSWNDAQEYVRWLSGRTGETYRLASEAEWEYAASAGTTTRFNTGNCITTDQANFRGTNPAQGCPAGQHRGRTTPVKSFAPNAWGLYDMHGNVWEWVADCWNGNYNGAPTDGSAWMSGDCSRAVARGGSWRIVGQTVRSAHRLNGTRGTRNDTGGFRVARSITL
ncbi:MAG: SUMF1/EgtB/PvdO family nonheme iron enzyme [Wenzhouxiangella sp.]